MKLTLTELARKIINIYNNQILDNKDLTNIQKKKLLTNIHKEIQSLKPLIKA
jgi:hypothetical protein|tara:strand:- start:766 stop:921 length:156 start_codon:yes stop_codon:yes gene_type:complete